MKDLFWLIILITPLALSAQGVNFNKNYDFFNTSDSLKNEYAYAIESVNDQYYVLCGVTQQNMKRKFMLLKLNEIGDIVDKNILLGTNDSIELVTVSSGGLTKYNNDKFAFVGYARFIGQDPIPFIGFADTSINASITFLDSLGFHGGLTQIKQLKNGSFIACGFKYSQTLIQPLIAKFDSNGNFLWHKIYNFNGDAISIDEVGNNLGYIVGGLKRFNKTHTHVFRTDTLGNIEWEYIKPLGNSTISDCPAYNIIYHKNKIAFCGCESSYSAANNFTKLYRIVGLLDLAGNEIALKQVGEVEVGSGYYMVKGLDDGYIAVGQSYVDFDTGGPMPGFITRFDDSLNVTWERKYWKMYDTDQHYLHDVQQTPDGGFVAAGMIIPIPVPGRPPHSQDAWVVKTDSMGCVVPGCHIDTTIGIGEDIIILDNALSVYPNPTSGKFHFTISDIIPIGEITLYNLVTGRAVRRESFNNWDGTNTMDISDNVPGVYLFQIRTAGGETYSGKVILIK